MQLHTVFKSALLVFAGTLLGFAGLKILASNPSTQAVELLENKDYTSTLTAVNREATKDAIRLLGKYFNSEATLTSFGLGPSGSWVVHASIDSRARKFFMLSDREHLIEGELYSPYMTSTNAPSEAQNNALNIARANDQRKAHTNQLQSEFISKVAEKNDNNGIATPEPTVQQNQKPTFKLPELNSVLSQDDKLNLLDKTRELQYIEVGEPSAPVIYVYFDFNCGGCRLTKAELAKYTSTGQLRVRYIPVGVITKESAIKAAYSLIPDQNTDRQILLDYFVQDGSAEELIRKKAPKDEVMKALAHVRKSNETFFFTPKKLTPTFIFELDNEVVIANLTSEKSIKNLVNRLNK